MKKNYITFSLIPLLLITLGCSNKDNPVTPTPVPTPIKVLNLQEELSLINWEEFNVGKVAYIKYDTLLLIDCESRTITKLMKNPYLLNMKWHPDGTMITGMKAVNPGQSGTQYLLKGITLEGEIVDLKTDIYFNTSIYDWFPDGRIAKIVDYKYFLIDHDYIPIDGLLPSVGYGKINDVVCNPNTNCVLVSFAKWDTIAGGITQNIYEIDISSYNRMLKLTRSNNNACSIIRMQYKPDGSTLLFLDYYPGSYGWYEPGPSWLPGSGGTYHQGTPDFSALVLFPSQLLKENSDAYSWCPDARDLILMNYEGDIYIRNLSDPNSERKVFSEAIIPLWCD